MNQSTRARQAAGLERLDRFSHWTDSSFRIPFTRFRFGFDPLIGLIPVLGDVVGLLLSLYVLYEAQRIGTSRAVRLRMIGNMLIEFFGGMLPVVGDAFDAIFKANTRNTALLRDHLEDQLGQRKPPPFPWFTLIWLSALIALFAVALAWLF